MEAEGRRQSALKQNPNDATARTDFGLSFYPRPPRDPDKASAAYRGALKIDPRYKNTPQNLTRALIGFDRGG
jgi:Flp pilus assembly protein TadD